MDFSLRLIDEHIKLMEQHAAESPECRLSLGMTKAFRTMVETATHEIEKLKDFQKAKEKTVELLKEEIRELEARWAIKESKELSMCLRGDDELREKLADLCHRQWSGWMEYLFSKCAPPEPNPWLTTRGVFVIPRWAVDRWKRQMKTPYSELSEEEKDSDRSEADKFLALLKEHCQEQT